MSINMEQQEVFVKGNRLSRGDTSLHVHLCYPEVAEFLFYRLSKVWDDKIHISLVKGGEHNQPIIKKAVETFDNIEVILVDNKGVDQYGFYKSFRMSVDQQTKYVLYMHDKRHRAAFGANQDTAGEICQWALDMYEPFLSKSNLAESLKLIRQDNIGLVTSGKCREKMIGRGPTLYKNPSSSGTKHNRRFLMRSLCTIEWFDDLVRMFDSLHKKWSPEYIYPEFGAGNVFLAKRDVIEKVHACIGDESFEGGYQKDGRCEHGLERFYFYASQCLGYQTSFFGDGR